MRKGTRLLLLVTLTMVLALFAPTIRGLLSRVEAFAVVEVAVEGNHYLNAAEVRDAAAIPEDANLWDDLDSAETRLRAHPAIADVRIVRRMPGRLVVQISEREPVALLPNPTLVPLDDEGLFLPIDPALHPLDLPLIHPRRDPAGGGPLLTSAQVRSLVEELGMIADLDPEVGANVSDVALDLWGDVMVRLESGILLTYRAPLTARRLEEGMVVLADVRERHPEKTPIAIDLRFVDQVVVRLAPKKGG
jgi:cell division protein FtsQ